MNFSFFHPLLWIGALAVAGPLWLHLFRRREQNLKDFSAVRFLDDQPVARRSPLRLRDVLLLVLRILALLLIVAAFAWPFIRAPANNVVAESRVYILDNTLSHQANNGFAQDRDRFAHEIAQTSAGTQIAAVELTSQPRVVGSFGDARELVRQRVLELQPTFQRGSYLAAFRQANTLLANSLGGRKRIVLLGDSQSNQWTEYANTLPFLQDVEITLPKPRVRELPNLSLAEPHADRIFLGDRSLVDFAVRLEHRGPAKRATVELRGNGQSIVHRAIDLGDQPGTIVVQAQWELDPSLWLRGEVTVAGEPDALAGDNRVFFFVPPVRAGTVALLAQSKYLRLALGPETMRGRWTTEILEPSQLAGEIAGDQEADVLCLESNYLQSTDARKLMTRYLSNGRGVVLLVNRVTPLVAAALREFGFEPQDEVNVATNFKYVFVNHPIFHPFVSPDFGNLGEVRVLQRTPLKAARALPLVFSEEGDPLMFQALNTSGKLFVCTFGLDRAQTTWPVHPTFIPFLDLCLQTARAADTTPTMFEPGELCVLSLPADATTSEVVLRDGEREISRTPVVEHRARFAVPATPGLYAVTYDGGSTVERMLAVNPSPKESELTYVETPEALTAWQLPRSSDSRRNAVVNLQPSMTLAAILQQRIWWWALLAGAMVFLVETVWVAHEKERHEMGR